MPAKRDNLKRVGLNMSSFLFDYYKARAEMMGLAVSSVMIAALQEQMEQKGAIKSMAEMMDAYKVEQSKQKPADAQHPTGVADAQ